MKLKTKYIFNLEVGELIELYIALRPYFDKLEIKGNWKEESIESSSKEITEKLDFKHISRKNRSRGYRIGLSFTFRELLFVRIISAFEVFLIDTIKEVFKINKAPFKNIEKKISLSQAELLSFDSISGLQTKILNSEIRSLSSGGYKKIERYYERKFGVIFSNLGVDKSKVERYHEIRHLIVHRLGRTDDKYKKSYKTLKKGISIPEELLITTINDLNNLVNGITEKIEDMCFISSKESTLPILN